MRIVFFGTPEIAVPTLKAVAEAHTVMALVCQPDKAQGRSGKLTPPPTKAWAEARGVATHQPTKLNDGAFEAWLREQAPDVCVLVAYGRILKQPILDTPPHGFLNMHPSLLPRHRGPSPIQTAILRGDATTGVTIMRLDAGMDTGDVLLQESLPILPDDTAGALGERLATRGAALMVRGLALVEEDKAVFSPQDPRKATETRLFLKEDGRIRWSAPAREIRNLVRAAHPWPVAHCSFNGEVCRIHAVEVVETAAAAPPGTVVCVERDRIVVATGRDGLAILVFQAPGKRALPMGDFLRGRPIVPGERFEDL